MNKQEKIFIIGLSIVAVVVFSIIVAFNTHSKYYQLAYNACEKEPVSVITDCKCVAKCMEKAKNKSKILAFDENIATLCLMSCVD